MRESRKSSTRIGLAAAGLAACLAATSLTAPAYAADKGGEGRGFAGLLRMFNIFASHKDEKPSVAEKAVPSVATNSGVKVTTSSSADGSAKMGIEIPLDDPASVARGDGAFVYLETGSDVVDAADLNSRLPKTPGQSSPTSPVQSLATRTAALGGAPAHGVSLGAPVDGLQTGSMWSFTPRYAGVHFGISYLSEGTPGVNNKGFEFGVTSSFLRSDFSTGLKGAFLNAPLLGSDRHISNIGFHLGYAGVTFGGSLQRDRTDLVGTQSAYDLGVKYRRGAFSTSLQFSSSTSQTSKGLLFRVNPDNRTYAFEFGAAYHLRPGISLGGGLQYFNYNSVTLVPENDDAAVVFLGGNVNF